MPATTPHFGPFGRSSFATQLPGHKIRKNIYSQHFCHCRKLAGPIIFNFDNIVECWYSSSLELQDWILQNVTNVGLFFKRPDLRRYPQQAICQDALRRHKLYRVSVTHGTVTLLSSSFKWLNLPSNVYSMHLDYSYNKALTGIHICQWNFPVRKELMNRSSPSNKVLENSYTWLHFLMSIFNPL